MNIGIIGAGASGMMAAIVAAGRGASVTLYEKNERPGRKLLITGKGRCNLTNSCARNEFIANVPKNPKFLYSALSLFSPDDTMSFFEKLGVPLKVERGNRVFPCSDKASDIVDALSGECRRQNVHIVHAKVSEICADDGAVSGVIADGEHHAHDAVIVATGGLSYPRTGSTGDGYKLARKLGIEVTELTPSLVPLECLEHRCVALQGLSLKNVAISVVDTASGGKEVYRDFGEMMFTHFGVTGPMILSASAYLKGITPGRYKISIDLKPALDEQTLDRRLLSDFAKYSNKNYSNALCDLLPSKLIGVFVSLSGIDPTKKVNCITKAERARIAELMKNFTVTVKRARPIDEAIITSGGIDIKEISPKTMESKKVRGLYFAGEVIDVDAYTGGFNLQIAFSTAYTAAISATSEI